MTRKKTFCSDCKLFIPPYLKVCFLNKYPLCNICYLKKKNLNCSQGILAKKIKQVELLIEFKRNEYLKKCRFRQKKNYDAKIRPRNRAKKRKRKPQKCIVCGKIIKTRSKYFCSSKCYFIDSYQTKFKDKCKCGNPKGITSQFCRHCSDKKMLRDSKTGRFRKKS